MGQRRFWDFFPKTPFILCWFNQPEFHGKFPTRYRWKGTYFSSFNWSQYIVFSTRPFSPSILVRIECASTKFRHFPADFNKMNGLVVCNYVIDVFMIILNMIFAFFIRLRHNLAQAVPKLKKKNELKTLFRLFWNNLNQRRWTTNIL